MNHSETEHRWSRGGGERLTAIKELMKGNRLPFTYHNPYDSSLIRFQRTSDPSSCSILISIHYPYHLGHPPIYNLGQESTPEGMVERIAEDIREGVAGDVTVSVGKDISGREEGNSSGFDSCPVLRSSDRHLVVECP